MDVGQRHWAIQRLDVHMGIADVAYIHVGGSALQNYIATKLFSMQRTGSGMQGHAGVDRDQDFVIHASGIGGGAGEKVRNDILSGSRLQRKLPRRGPSLPPVLRHAAFACTLSPTPYL